MTSLTESVSYDAIASKTKSHSKEYLLLEKRKKQKHNLTPRKRDTMVATNASARFERHCTTRRVPECYPW